MASRHAVATIFRQQHVVTGAGYPGWEVWQIVGHDLAIAMPVHHSFCCWIDFLVITGELAAIGSIDPARIGERVWPWEKVAACHQRMIEDGRRFRHSTCSWYGARDMSQRLAPGSGGATAGRCNGRSIGIPPALCKHSTAWRDALASLVLCGRVAYDRQAQQSDKPR